MEVDAQTTFREIATGNLAIDGKEATLLRNTFRYVEHGRIPWLKTARLWHGNTLHNVEIWDADTDTGALSSVIKQVVEDGHQVTRSGIDSIQRRGKNELVSREVSFEKIGPLLVGHCKNENLATGRTTHSLSLGRFGLRKALGINR